MNPDRLTKVFSVVEQSFEVNMMKKTSNSFYIYFAIPLFSRTMTSHKASYCDFSDSPKVKDNSSCKKAHTIPELSSAQTTITCQRHAKLLKFK